MKFNIKVRTKIKYTGFLLFLCGIFCILLISYVSEATVKNQANLQKIVWVAFAILGYVLVVTKYRSKETRKYINTLGIFVVPFAFAIVYTLIIVLCHGDKYGVLLQSITTTGFILVDILMVFSLGKFYKTKMLSLACWSVIGSYVITLFFDLQKLGFAQLVAQFKLGTDMYFERHDVGVAVVPLLLVYVYLFINKKEKFKFTDYLQIIGLTLVLFMCGKRSAYMSILTGTLLIMIFKMSKRHKKAIAMLLLCFVFVCCYLYVYGIRSGSFDFLLKGTGTLRDRYYVWKQLDSFYNFSILYFGKGYQFVHKYMISGDVVGMVADYKYLHNSILQIFIEVGFVGFTIWMAIYLFMIPYLTLISYGESAFIFCTISIISMLAMFTVDNTLTYPLYQTCLMISLYTIYLIEKEEVYAGSKCNCDNL